MARKFNYGLNLYGTTDLVLNVMRRIASQLKVDIHDDQVADVLYDVCSGLESYPEDQGFGSSDSYVYAKAAERELVALGYLAPKFQDAFGTHVDLHSSL